MIPAFDHGDEVMITMRKPEDGFPNGQVGTVRSIKYKKRPRWGKTPGYWYVVRGTMSKGATFMAEVHEDCLLRSNS